MEYALDGEHLGLSAYLTAWDDARLAKMYLPRTRDVPRGGGPRGTVDGKFPRQARARLMNRMQTIRRDEALPLMLTFTFPDLFPEAKWAKRSMDAMFKRWKRKHAKRSAIWRMELMDRKSGTCVGQIAPHFHMLVWGHYRETYDAHVVAMIVEEMRHEWSECVVNVEATRRKACAWPRQQQVGWDGKIWYGDSAAHVEHGTLGQGIMSWNGATSYAAKYCAELSDVAMPGAGRVWGVHNRSMLPVQTEEQAQVVTMPLKTGFRVVRTIRRFIRANRGEHDRGRKTTTGRVFSVNPQKWIDFALHEIDRDNAEQRSLLRKAEMLRGLKQSHNPDAHFTRQAAIYAERRRVCEWWVQPDSIEEARDEGEGW